ncbi:hypothetical protein N0V93_007575 [Gnomoniopsis smithogilvyi]|uniref:Cytochrome P450 n=1 Tax=Gnomoniopsis smithogilvyi TaxID=1191159 RepID=A0A9W8YQA6_9PEZI|nr:hypothetical protein N0V93_007575 [Gnomoniopsis smithogilvyi]
MHDKYGPLIRISPDELHCADVDFSDEIFAIGTRKRNKPAHQVNGTVLTIAEFGTIDHDLHRSRRAPVAKFFSRSNVAQLEGEIKEFVQLLCDKLLRESGRQPVELKAAYSCFTADVVSSYAFGQSIGFLNQPLFTPNFKESTESALKTCHVFRWFPILKNLDKLATTFVDYLPADLALLVRTMQIELPERIVKIRDAVDAGLLNTRDRHTIFGEILTDEATESKEKGTERLAIEAFAIMGAGTETTAATLSLITYQILKHPEILDKLIAELEQNGLINDPRGLPSFLELERLPYLGAVIKEGLRLSYGVSSRTARIATEEDLVYRGEWNKKDVEYIIPRGYGVGMSTVVTHHNESIFPDSHRFLPERWLDDQNKPDKGLMAFGKGSRRCLASNLAITEIHFTVVALAIRVWPRMSLFETSDEDLAYDHDMFVPMPKKGSMGLRVTIS